MSRVYSIVKIVLRNKAIINKNLRLFLQYVERKNKGEEKRTESIGSDINVRDVQNLLSIIHEIIHSYYTFLQTLYV